MRMVKIEQDAMVLAPRDVPSAKHERYEQLINAAQKHGPITVAVVHPCDGASMSGALAASRLRLIKPILVGPVERLRSVAEHAGLQIDGIELVSAAHSHDSAAQAVALVAAGSADALMKGSLHTDELMGAVVSSHSGIRTERRISHCFVMDVPGYPEPLIITDAAINIAPDLDAKVDIVQNAIDLAHAIGVHEVRVAILSALETVTVKVPSTIEAAALCKMAERGQIRGALVDGPLALDNAISPQAAIIKKLASLVAGRANVLVVPDLEAGNMLAKSLSFLAKADAAGIVLGARVPIILTSRADSLTSRLASCAVAVMIVAARRKAASVCWVADGKQADASNGPCVSALRQRNATFHRKLALRGERVPAWLGQPVQMGLTAEVVSAPQQSGNSRFRRCSGPAGLSNHC